MPNRTRVRFHPAPLRRPVPLAQPSSTGTFDALVEKINEFHNLYKEIQDGIELVKKAHAAFESVKQGPRGLDGVGLRGKPGADGKNVTAEQVHEAVQKHIRQPKDAEPADPAVVAEHIVAHPTFEKLLKKHIKHGKDAQPVATDALVSTVLEELQKKGGKKIAIEDIDGLEKKFNEIRAHVNASKEWRGGGDTVVAGTGVLITNTVNGNKRISASGGTSTVLIPTGTVDGVNRTFVFATAPNVIALDNGNFMNKVSLDGTINWTGTTTVTLNQAPLFNIFGL